ncbi:hypothetical protein [Corynebacterium mastitidis]|uniref:hypothetical protein n=1 Tax=Corynebacterium mastitidis TaxID=161890 RepID=UPI0012EAAE4B|nr:hypothetical protein [Corynebacterium mastitidis]
MSNRDRIMVRASEIALMMEALSRCEALGSSMSEALDDLHLLIWDMDDDDDDAAADHPGFLVTEEDYEGAPEGTIVVADEELPFWRSDEGWCCGGGEVISRDMRGVSRRVVRWGWAL